MFEWVQTKYLQPTEVSNIPEASHSFSEVSLNLLFQFCLPDLTLNLFSTFISAYDYWKWSSFGQVTVKYRLSFLGTRAKLYFSVLPSSDVGSFTTVVCNVHSQLKWYKNYKD